MSKLAKRANRYELKDGLTDPNYRKASLLKMNLFLGQHLVSAILEKDYNINTLSWWMAESTPSKV